MPQDVAESTLRQTNLSNESAAYLAKREELRLAELELMRQRERVAEMRRHLPPGAVLQDYEFQEGPACLDSGDSPVRTVRLTELFSARDRSLIAYHLMFGKRQTSPCPMCTSLIDGLNGLAPHIEQTADMVIVAAAEPEALRAHARTRGWDKLRLLSAGDSSFKYDMGSEDRSGNQDSTISVFTLGADGVPRHFYSAHPRMSAELNTRGLDLLNPIWNYLDLTPQGRGDFTASLDYPERPWRQA